MNARINVHYKHISCSACIASSARYIFIHLLWRWKLRFILFDIPSNKYIKFSQRNATALPVQNNSFISFFVRVSDVNHAQMVYYTISYRFSAKVFAYVSTSTILSSLSMSFANSFFHIFRISWNFRFLLMSTCRTCVSFFFFFSVRVSYVTPNMHVQRMRKCVYTEQVCLCISKTLNEIILSSPLQFHQYCRAHEFDKLLFSAFFVHSIFVGSKVEFFFSVCNKLKCCRKKLNVKKQ